MKKQRIFVLVAAVAICALVVGTLVSMNSAHSTSKSSTASLTLYTAVTKSEVLDTGSTGTTDGDETFIYGTASLTPNGPYFGDEVYMSVTVRVDIANNRTWRDSTWDYSLPEGTIMVSGVIDSVIGKSLGKGDVVHLVILGGTGIYRGVRGEMIGTVEGDSPPIQKAEFFFVK